MKVGRVQPGSYLLVESLDRLSREKIRPALTLLLNLIEAGIKVVQLIPVEVVYDEDVEPMVMMQAIMELSRGHSESAVKSARGAAAWVNKRKHASERVLTKMVPSWVEHRDGKLVLDKAKAAVVRRIFEAAVLSQLREVKASDINGDNEAARRVEALASRKPCSVGDDRSVKLNTS